MEPSELGVVRPVGGPYDGQELRVAPGEAEKHLLVDLQLFGAGDHVIKAAQRGEHPATNQDKLCAWLN